MRRTVLYLFVFIQTSLLFGQDIDKGFSQASNKAQEQTFIHYNSSLLMPGESLLYSLYNINNKTGQLSELSKIAKVRLIDSEEEIVFEHILKLEKGVGYSDFLIPSSLPTGIYSLIGYTEWMLNFDNKGVFEEKLVIINPFMNESDSTVKFSDEAIQDSQSYASQRSASAIKMNKESFGNRDKVVLNLETELVEGAALSVSVRRLDSIIPWSPVSTLEIKKGTDSNFSFVTLPEVRGRNLKGMVEKSEGGDIQKKLEIAYFIPGEPEKLRIFETDNTGNFQFQISDKIDYENAFMKIISDNDDSDYNIRVSSPEFNFPVASQAELIIPESRKEPLKTKAIHNQVQQSYKSVFADSLINNEVEIPFYGDRGIIFNLDEYTRFKTMQETFVEIIQYASFKRNGEDRYVEIFGLNSRTNFGAPALVLINGVPILDHNYLYNFDPAKVETIEVVRDKYFMGPKTFQGVVNLSTFSDIPMPEMYKTEAIELKPAEAEKLYFQPDYTTGSSEFSRVPDYRYQLLWIPQLTKNKVEFYTSDVSGVFEIRVEGFKKNGQKVSLRKTFEVK